MWKQPPKNFVTRRCRIALYYTLFAVVALSLVLHFFATKFRGYQPQLSHHSISTSDNASFHLIVPATSANLDLCRLLLSITALGYPAPILVNWGNIENDNSRVQHLQKIDGILNYLLKLPAELDDDLALIIDGYDVLFQLKPDVVIQRYYGIAAAANERLAARMGKKSMQENGIFSSILFGPDKLCWPEDPARPACWAVPQSTMPQYAFGPETDQGRWRDLTRPRWLNSGTIIGPVGDLRKLFQSTLDVIQAQEETKLSDQYYMAQMWGLQEYARTLLAEGPVEPTNVSVWKSRGFRGQGNMVDVELDIPNIDEAENYEYHIMLDHESQLFQPVTFYWRYLAWTKHERSLDTGRPEDAHNLQLPQDILNSPPPFSEVVRSLETRTSNGTSEERIRTAKDVDIPLDAGWDDVLLGTNFASGHIFALIHFTPPKEFRRMWYHHLWFMRYAKSILELTTYQERRSPVTTTPDGRTWYNYQYDSLDDIVPSRRVGGAFGDRGGWHSWREMCSVHEDDVFNDGKFSDDEPV